MSDTAPDPTAGPPDAPRLPSAPASDVSGLILAGGLSRRFGSDKALALLEGRALIRHVYDALSAVADPVYLSVADSGRRYDIPVPHLADLHPGAGPLAGLQTGLLFSRTPWLLVCAVDLPFVTPAHLQELVSRRSPVADALVYRVSGRPQPVCALYHRRILPRVEARLSRHEFSLMGLLESLETVHYLDGDAILLHNVNRPDDLGERM